LPTLALAWVLCRTKVVLAITGSSRPEIVHRFITGDAGQTAHMEGMKEAIAAVVIILVLADFILTAVRICRNPQHRRTYSDTVRSIRWWMVPAGLAHLVAVGATAVLLFTLVPPLRYGWWSLLGGSGNVLLGQTGNSGTPWRLVGIILPLSLVVVVPWLAHLEESTFRAGSEDRSVPRRLAVQLGFGLIHCVSGVPLAPSTSRSRRTAPGSRS
jgi:hypothetical protein